MAKGGKGGGGGGGAGFSPQITALAQQQGDIAKQQAQMGEQLFGQTAGLRAALLGSPGMPGTPGSTGQRIIGYSTPSPGTGMPYQPIGIGDRDLGPGPGGSSGMAPQPIYENFAIPGTPATPGTPGLLQAMLQPRPVRTVPPAVQIPEPVVTPQEREGIERQYQIAGQQALGAGIRGGALETNLANLAAARAGQVSGLQSALAREQRGVTLQQRLLERGTAEEQQQAQLTEQARQDAAATGATSAALAATGLGMGGLQGATASAGAAGQQLFGLEHLALQQSAAQQAMFGQLGQSAGTAVGLKGLGKGAKTAAAANPSSAIPFLGSSVIDLLPGFIP